MIIINEQAMLIIEDIDLDEYICKHAYITYKDGNTFDIGYIKEGEGNFLFDNRYVYKWPFNKGEPIIYDTLERHEVIDKEEGRLILGKYKKYL